MKNVGKGVGYMLVTVLAIAALVFVALVGIGKQHKGTTEHIRLGLDLAGGVSVTYEAVGDKITDTSMNDTVYKLQKRVEGLGEEPVVYRQGDTKIVVDIPGVDDSEAVLEKLGKAGYVAFIKYDDLKQYLGTPKKVNGKTIEVLKDGVTKEQLDKDGVVLLDGSHIDKAVPNTINEESKQDHVVSLKFNGKGAKKFEAATTKCAGGNMAIVYDGVVVSNPRVDKTITGDSAQIEGMESFEKASELATTIRIGALPLELKQATASVVGAKLGDNAIKSSLIAGVIGLVLVILFMIVMYRIPGLAASIALLFYVTAISFVMNSFDVTLTLPGIAGILLSIGMAVDANVIIFTRIKEELAAGNSLETSLKNGFGKALSAILDGNITTIIASIVLLNLGSGTVSSFAKTLLIGVILSMFTALYVTRFVLNGLIALGFTDEKFFGKAKETKKFGFVKAFPKFGCIALVFILVCVGSLIYNNSKMGTILNYGLDFSGGTSYEVTFEDDVNLEEIKGSVAELVQSTLKLNPEISTVKSTTVKALTIKTATLTDEQVASLRAALEKQYKVKDAQYSSISASVSSEMKTDAVKAIVIAVILMLIYIAIRFTDITFGLSAILALIHDVLIVLMVYGVGSAVGLISVGNTFIACMLTILGYSINSTIVTFDRIRENKKLMKKTTPLEEIVDTSVNQTVSRNINTSLTTFIMIFMLLIFGVTSLREFTIPLMGGLIAGAYSSICLTSSLWYRMKTAFSKASINQ